MPCKVSTNVGKLFCQDGIFNSMNQIPVEIQWELGADSFHVPVAGLSLIIFIHKYRKIMTDK